MSDDLDKLKVYQVVKSEEDYALASTRRIRRLEQSKAQIPDSSVGKSLDRCIQLTLECSRTADTLGNTRNALRRANPRFANHSEMLDSIIAFQDILLIKDRKAREISKSEEMRDAYIRHQTLRAKAKEVALEAIEGRVDDTTSLVELLERRIPDYDPWDKAVIKTEFGLIYFGFSDLAHLFDLTARIVQWADQYRALFYMGIVNVDGGEWDQQAISNYLADLGGEVLGLLFGVQDVVSLTKITTTVLDVVQEFRGIDTPGLIPDAQVAEQFIARYELALKYWSIGAQAYITAMRNTAKTLGQYKVSQ